jgi:two-component system, cell cycle sensor histidine kinase and response regulator CckA
MSPSFSAPLPRALRALLAALGALSLVVPVLGYDFYGGQRARLLALELEALAAVADARVVGADLWRRERLGDVRAAVEGLAAAGGIGRLDDGDVRRHAVDHLAMLCRAYGYRVAQVFDAGGRALLTTDARGASSPLPLPGAAFAALAQGDVVHFERAAEAGRGRFHVLGRILDERRALAGALALTMDGDARLAAQLGGWPLLAAGAESFLAEVRDGELVALLAQPGAARAPSLSPDSAARRERVLTQLGVGAYRDADDEEVLAIVRQLPESRWRVVAVRSRWLVEEPIRVAATRIAAGVLLLLAAVWSSALLLWLQHRARQARSERERADELRLLVEHAPDAIFVTDATGELQEANAAASRLSGRERAELVGRPFAQLLDASAGAARALALDGLADDESTIGECHLMHSDGERLPVEVSATALPDGRRIAFVRDLRERRRIASRMQLLSRALEVSPAPVIITDREGRIEYVNRRYSEVTGFAVDELVGTLPRFLDPESTSFDRSAGVTAAVLAGREWEGELVDRRKDGELFFWRLRIQSIANDAGELEHLLGIGEDVSERRRQRERFSLARRLVRMGIYEWDFQRRALWWSDETYELFGVDRESFTPGWDSYFALVVPEDRVPLERAFRAAVESEAPFDVEYRVRPAEGEERRLRSVLEIVRDAAGVPLAALGVTLDVTEQRAAESALGEAREHLHRAQKMEALGRLAGGVAHDFNNLLGIILGYADLLVDELASKSARERVEEIRGASLRAAELTGQLLAFGRRQALELRRVEIASLFAEAEPLLRRMVPENVSFRVELADDLGAVSADPAQLQQVLVNLALNARDAMPRGGELRITVRPERVESDRDEGTKVSAGDYVRIEVADTGHGMTREVLEHAFEPFYTTKEAHEGSGLGLATVYGIVRQLGGHVWLESTPGRGARATVLLPRMDAEEGARIPVQGVAPPRKIRILIVEDVEPLGRMIEQMLDGHGYEVTLADVPERALELASAAGADWDVLLTDLVMPGMDGVDLAQRMRTRFPGLRVVLMSGYPELLARAGGVGELGIDAALQKPFTRARLESVLAAALSGSEIDTE